MTTPQYPAGPPSSGASTTGSGADSGADSGKKEQAKQAAGTAADEGKKVAGVAKDQAASVAGVAKEEAGHVAAEAKQQARGLLDEAKSQVDEQSRSQRDRLVGTLQEFSTQLERMASGEGGEPGMAQDVVRQVAEKARDLGSRMDGREPADLLDEVRRYAQRKPGTFLLGALAAGVLAGRVTRGAKQASSSGSSDSDRYASPYDNPRGAGLDYDTAGTGYPVAQTSDTTYPAAGTGYADAGVSPESAGLDPTDPTTPASGRTGPSVSTTGTVTGGTPDSPWTDNPTNRGGL